MTQHHPGLSHQELIPNEVTKCIFYSEITEPNQKISVFVCSVKSSRGFVSQLQTEAAHLEEAGDGSSATLVPVHPSHDSTSLDVSSSSVVGDALETVGHI